MVPKFQPKRNIKLSSADFRGYIMLYVILGAVENLDS